MMNLLIVLLVLFFYMSGAFLLSLSRHDNGVADIAYGGGFVLVVSIAYLLGLHSAMGLLACIFVGIWAIRLSMRIAKRNWNKPEDFRYAAWRKEWGTSFAWRSFLQVFMLQGAVIFTVALPVTLLGLFGQELGLGVIGGVGILLWVCGFLFEAVGDWQLDAFLASAESKGRLMETGLWRYTRHPNYFGESCMWWGLSLMAFDTLIFVTPLPLALLVFLGPLLITYLLLRVSGVPLVEARMKENPLWESYKNRTSVFFPLPPKKQ